jgi:hypothetical protein
MLAAGVSTLRLRTPGLQLELTNKNVDNAVLHAVGRYREKP